MRLRHWLFGLPVMATLGMATVARAQLAPETFDGRPEFKEGKALGYFVWRDGNTWKLRWMTFGAEHRFMGRVVAEEGTIVSFKRVDVDEERQVLRRGRPAHVVRGPRGRAVGVAPGRAPVVAERTEDKIEQEDEHTVQWLTRTNDDLDGLDVKVSESTTALRFNLQIDGEQRPLEVEIGKHNVKPRDLPLRVKLK